MADLHVDLIIQILHCLPVKSLLRFRCVCKSTRGLIDSRSFIKSHLNTTSDNKTHRNLIFRQGVHFDDDDDDDDDSTIAKFLVYNMDDGSQQLFYITDGFPTELRNLSSYNFFAHCDLYSLGVWNPSARKYKKFPPLLPNDDVHYTERLSFGYDSSSDDYKVLLIREVNALIGFWILGLRSCYWRQIRTVPYNECRLTGYVKTGHVRSCFIDGAFHFLCEGRIILAIDVANEVFSRIAFPNIGKPEAYPLDLQVFEGCLCVRFVFFGMCKSKLKLYIRKKDGVEFSWTKLFSTTSREVSAILGGLLGYLKGGDKMFILGDQDSSLYSYDVKEKSPVRIEMKDIDNRHIIFCIESLVSVDYQE